MKYFNFTGLASFEFLTGGDYLATVVDGGTDSLEPNVDYPQVFVSRPRECNLPCSVW